MSSFDRYISIENFKVSDADKEPDPLRGNLENVDKSKLTKASPKGLKGNKGKEYYLVNNETNEKTKGAFVRVDEIDDDYTEGVVTFQYFFKDKYGELFIEGDNVHIAEDKGDDDVYKNKDPYHKDITFDKKYSVYIPKSSEILLGSKLNTDVAGVIGKFGGKNKSKRTKRQRKTRKTKKQRKTRTMRRRETQKSKRRR
jgi:hypothetical protein